MTKHKHRPCPCGCGELADECMRPGSGLNAFSVSAPESGAIRFFTAPDAADEPTIWERTDGDPAVVVRRAELPGPRADLLWRVLTGVLCADDKRIRQATFDPGRFVKREKHTDGYPDELHVWQAKAVVTALAEDAE